MRELGKENFVYIIDYLDGLQAAAAERTPLTSGRLEAILDSRAARHKRLGTPHLGVRYTVSRQGSLGREKL